MKEFLKLEQRTEQLLNDLERFQEPYIDKILKLNKEFDELIFSMAEAGSCSIEELRRMSLAERIRYQEFLVNKGNKRKSG